MFSLLNREVTVAENAARITQTLSMLHHELAGSVEARVAELHSRLSQDRVNSGVAILFSGGLDCSVIARLAHDFVPKDKRIDLLNVAFENPRRNKAASLEPAVATTSRQLSVFESCPDRQTGRASFQELTAVCPDRSWNFVAIDVPHAEAVSHRGKVIKLMSPQNTEMDLSICLALYFASRGQGAIEGCGSKTYYQTPAKVL